MRASNCWTKQHIWFMTTMYFWVLFTTKIATLYPMFDQLSPNIPNCHLNIFLRPAQRNSSDSETALKCLWRNLSEDLTRLMLPTVDANCLMPSTFWGDNLSWNIFCNISYITYNEGVTQLEESVLILHIMHGFTTGKNFIWLLPQIKLNT